MKNYILHYYEPDFIIKLDKGIYLDIEIDEPYVGNNGKIIHYFDEEFNQSVDAVRDQFFLKNNWIIIRFAEEQIFKQPQACCKFIGEVIKNLNLEFDMSIFTKINTLKNVKVWNKEDALIMMRKRYRETYFPQSIRNSIKKNIEGNNFETYSKFGTTTLKGNLNINTDRIDDMESEEYPIRVYTKTLVHLEVDAFADDDDDDDIEESDGDFQKFPHDDLPF